MARDKKPASTDTVNSLAAPGALESGEEVKNYATDRASDIYAEALRLYPLVQKAYDGKQEQSDAIEEYWNIFQAKPDTNQQYSGNSQCYVPTVRDCIRARAKRRLKQLFPTKHRHVEAVGSTGETPFAQLALLEHYIRKTRLKEIARSLLCAGDVTGQWNLYIDWTRSYRRVTEDIQRNPSLEVADKSILPQGHQDIDLEDVSELEDATEEIDVIEEGPEIIDFATEDLAVVPPTCNDIEKAVAVSLRLRMSKEKVQQMVEEGVFVKEEGQSFDQFWEGMEKNAQASGKTPHPQKKRTQDAGIKTEGSWKFLLAYEVTARLSVPDPAVEGGKVKKLCYIYFASQNDVLGIVEAPQWGGKRPIISAPVERVSGSFFGSSLIEPVKFLQWNLNDYWNMGQDSAMYSLLPITMTDPLSNPNYASMVIGLAAVWSVDPNKTKFASMPALYKDAIPLCASIKSQIMESLDVNPMMLGQMPQGRKNNQLMGAMQQEQMTNIMDDAEYFEESVLTPLVERLAEYDRQFRKATLTTLTMGEIGQKAKMTELQPQQFGERFRYQWAGTNIVQGQMLQQQRIAGLNVLRGIPPQQLNRRRLDVTPIIERFVEDLYGPEMAPKILIDESNMFTVPAEIENEMMHNDLPVAVHEADNDQQHLIAHMSAARMTGDLNGRFRAHIAAHTMAMQAKMQQQMGVAQGQPGAPGAAAQPGIAGSPRMGAQSAGPRGNVQGPPGLPHPDQAVGPGRG